MEIRTERLLLREFRPDDLEAMREIESFPEIHTYEHHPKTSEELARAFIEHAVSTAAEQPRIRYRLVITIPPSDQMRGRVGLTLNYAEIREWEIGWQVHFLDWGKGYATEAARGMLRFAFHELNVHRVVAFCHAQNRRSERVMQKLGMQQDGLLRESRFWNGQWADELLYAILEREFTG